MLELQIRNKPDNPFPSTPIATEKYAGKLGGEAWKKVREDLIQTAKKVEATNDFAAAVLVGPPGTGKTHVCMNVSKELPSFFTIYVDASKYSNLEEGIIKSMEETSKRLGFQGISDYVSYRTMEYALHYDNNKDFEKKMKYDLKDRVFYFSFERYLSSLRNGRRYLTKETPFILRALAREVKITSFADFVSIVPTLSREMGFRALLIVDETEQSYERELKVIYNSQPAGLFILTTFVPDRWAEIKDKALKDRFYSASLFRQLGYPRAEDLTDILLSYTSGYAQFTRDAIEEFVVKGGLTDIRDALRKLHDAYDECSGDVDCMMQRISGFAGDKNEVSRTIEKYLRWQVMASLKAKSFIRYYSEKGKKIPAINSGVDLVFATDDVLYLGDVRVTDEESLTIPDDANVLRASHLGGIELNGKVYQKLRPFVVTNRLIQDGVNAIVLTPEEINLIKDGFNPPSVEEKIIRMLKD